MFKPHFISAFDGLTSSTQFTSDHILVTFFNRPDTVVTIVSTHGRNNLLTTSLAEINVLTVDAFNKIVGLANVSILTSF